MAEVQINHGETYGKCLVKCETFVRIVLRILPTATSAHLHIRILSRPSWPRL